MRSNEIYEFVFRGILTEEALDRTGRKARHLSGHLDSEIAAALSLDLLDPEYVDSARQMSIVYTAITAFENSARKLIQTVLLDEVGEDWWQSCVSQTVKKNAAQRREDEERTKWHTQRGEHLLYYTVLGDLTKIIQNNWERFEPHVRSMEWSKNMFDVLEKARNVIMHGGTLDSEDIARIGIYIRDWIKQVGA